MSQIYLKREIAKDGLPDSPGYYFVFESNVGMQKTDYFDGAEFDVWNVTHWLEPVEWPTEEEITKEHYRIADLKSPDLDYFDGFDDALNWLKSRLSNSH